MNTTFIINGGAGRVVASIPVLEKFARLNPDDDFRILISGWENLFWSHPTLQKRSFSLNQKGVFENFIKNNRLVCPEPYYVHGYYNQQLSLSEAFDEEINSTRDHGDLEIPKLYISPYELQGITRIIHELKKNYNKSKIIVFQPFGSGCNKNSGVPIDRSNRSLLYHQYVQLAEKISKDCLIVYFGQKDLKFPTDSVTVSLDQYNADLRMYMSLISQCDYFIGCDSLGQHIARAFNKPGTVIMGSTIEKNVSYPDHFRILRKAGRMPTYDPIRINHFDSEFANRDNDGIMDFTNEELENFANVINMDLYNE